LPDGRAAGNLPFTAHPDGVLVVVHLTPKARHARVSGLERRADESVALKVAVTAVPEKGKANKALLKLLSKTWGVGMQSLRLIRGQKDRYKTVLIEGDPVTTLNRVVGWGRELESPEQSGKIEERAP
jgi:uncharacterized protein (TIGR00251 family)